MHERLRVLHADGRTLDGVATSPAALRAAASKASWIGLLWPGETDEHGVLLAALRLAESQPESVGAISVRRAETASGISRARDVVRVVRPGQIVAIPDDGDESPVVAGELALLGGDALVLDRSRVGGATALATAAEYEGDWLKAASAWALAAEGQEPMGAWCELRQGLALARLAPTAGAVRRAFASALGRFPGLPEAAMGLAAVALGLGRHGDARRFIHFADSLDGPPQVVPQPGGAGSWYVPAAASRLLSIVDPEASARFLEEALRRGLPTPSVTSPPAETAEGAFANHRPG
jgi:hypothetical protein